MNSLQENSTIISNFIQGDLWKKMRLKFVNKLFIDPQVSWQQERHVPASKVWNFKKQQGQPSTPGSFAAGPNNYNTYGVLKGDIRGGR